MTAADWYLICFVVGFGLTAISFFMGVFSFQFHVNLLHGHVHVPHVHVGHGHFGHVGHGVGHADAGAAHGAQSQSSSQGGELPYINFGTITAFLAWFGGMGYLLTQHTHFMVWTTLVLSAAAGWVGATVVFMLVSRLLARHDKPMDDYENHPMGALGRVVSTIRAGGTGEIIYFTAEGRGTSGARAEDGGAIAKGTEIIVTRYEKGIAYVRTWEEANAEVDARVVSSK